MRQTIKKLLWISGGVLWLANARAFSLLGPDMGYPGLPPNFGDAWQIQEIGYNPIPLVNGGITPLDLLYPLHTGPKNLGEGYRRNTPVMFYAADANFLDYFGSNGVVALDNAFAILNNVFTNTPAVAAYGLDAYSPGLTEFPLNSEEINYQAQALNLTDLKSETLALMVEQLGLADAIRYVWTLHTRYQPPNTTCPNNTEYLVVMRNFDITASPLNQLQYSPYVNGELYTYVVVENCHSPFSQQSSDAVEIPTDPLFYNPPVSSGMGVAGEVEENLFPGLYYTGLTRDDVAGLRYLLSTNNINVEDTATNSLLISSTSGGTNYGTPFVLYSSNYTALFLSSQTNGPATLANLFPGLVITSTITNFIGELVPIIGFATNPVIGAPYGTYEIVIVTNGFTPTVLTNYTYTFGNVVILATNSFRTNASAAILTVQIWPLVGAPAGTLSTNVTLTPIILTNVPSGAYYISTNPCGPNIILSTLLTNVVATTNLLVAFTNAQGYSVAQSLITYFTNYVFVAEPLICASSGTSGQASVAGLYQGIGQMQFVRANYDSLLGQFFSPITNIYTMVFITNNQSLRQTFQRIVTAPDFLFSAQDLANGPDSTLTVVANSRNEIPFDFNHALPGLAGPGTINPSSTLIFDKVGPVYYNESPEAMNGPIYGASWVWGSFDGTTNDPIVYPNGSSIQNLASQVLIQIYSTPSTLPVGTNGVSYTASFSATGGETPYTWTLAPGTQLPNGLTLSTAGVISGTPTGNPSGVYVFTIQLTDAANRVESVNYFITIQ
jgi:hypothetical protein